MLERELGGEPYNKSDHNRRLAKLLHGRSTGAIEFKHQNISAILIELDFPYIEGYKPRRNYQEALREEVSTALAGNQKLHRAAAKAVEAAVTQAPGVRALAEIIVPAPVRERGGGHVYERTAPSLGGVRTIDYLAREALNASLGKAGEEFVLRVEQERLRTAGKPRLAARIEHVARTRGDGLGYDILSFEPNGRERLIEVKTTTFGAMTPFFATAREVSVSEERREHFSLYRVFRFRESPKLFALNGSLRQSCILEAREFRARLR